MDRLGACVTSAPEGPEGPEGECMIEGSLEVKLPTIWTVEKQR